MSVALYDFKPMTYDDYYKMEKGDKRYELIDGELYAMAAPSINHQTVLVNLIALFHAHLRGGRKCKLLPAPIDVRLNHKKGDDTVLQPDLIVVCDPSKIKDGKSVRGAPDLVVEISSPSTRKHDLNKKLPKYREAGVAEIWLIDPETKMIMVFKPRDTEENLARIYTTDEEITPGILPDLVMDTNHIFEM